MTQLGRLRHVTIRKDGFLLLFGLSAVNHQCSIHDGYGVDTGSETVSKRTKNEILSIELKPQKRNPLLLFLIVTTQLTLMPSLY